MNNKQKYPLLSHIDLPADLRKLKHADLTPLANELREFIIEGVSVTGGHFGGNLGAVELTIALHYIYDTPRDLIVWDVGAQAYPHKILTGRRDRFSTLRQYGGIAPFPKPEESPYDTFAVGHSSTSISAALGMAVARDQRGEDHKIIAVIGDGGMTGGLAFEGLNNTGASGRDITIILNDNSMSISPNVGALSQHLSAIRADPRFEKIKDSMWQIAGRLPKGSKLRQALRGVDAGIRAMLIPGIWFERLGFRYVGPIDGHNLPELLRMFRWLKGIKGPVLLHILTVKGKGYAFAESDHLHLHAISKMNPKLGPAKSSGGEPDFSAHFSDELLKIAKDDPRVIAITPAMIAGSKLAKFEQELPDRCFDVGIAEQHSVTFAAGLAIRGMKPVVAIYSTFLQRAFDQLVHDVALQNLPVVFGVDRAGLVGQDGPTHHGSFDISFLRHIPNLTLFVPRDHVQMRRMLHEALKVEDGPVVIRFPRGASPKYDIPETTETDVWKAILLKDGSDGIIAGNGIILVECLEAARKLQDDGLDVAVLDLQCLKPLDVEFLTLLAQRFPRWMSVEENVLYGGAGSALLEFFSDRGFAIDLRRLGIPDQFITHGDRANLLKEIGLDAQSIHESARDHFSSKLSRSQRRIRTTSQRV